MNDERAIEDLREEVLLLMGKCLYNLQVYERRLKGFLAASMVTVDMPTPDAEPTYTAVDTEKKTLGTLTGTLFRDVYTQDERPWEPDDGNATGNTLSFRYTVGLEPDSRRLLENELADFVSDRNDFIHHFAVKYDLEKIEHCRAAIPQLKRLREATLARNLRIQTDIENLIKVRQKASQILAEKLEDPQSTPKRYEN